MTGARAYDVQFVPRRGFVELSAGILGSDLLPAGVVQQAARDLLAHEPYAALSYGSELGPFALREWIAAGASCAVDEVGITAGTSSALSRLCDLLGSPGEDVLCDERVYDRALAIFRERGLRPHAIAAAGPGMAVDALEARLRTGGERVAFVYQVPTLNNPTTRTLPLETRRRLLDVCAAHGVTVVEDDPYHALACDPPPPTLRSLDADDTVVRLGSFSKTVAPGLRVGWVEGPPRVVSALCEDAAAYSGGGRSHFAAMLVQHLCVSGAWAAHVDQLRLELGRRLHALSEALEAEGVGRAEAGRGGMFVWLELDCGVDEADLVGELERRRVSVLGGTAFACDRAADPAPALRLSCSMEPEPALRAAASEIARATNASSQRSGRRGRRR